MKMNPTSHIPKTVLHLLFFVFAAYGAASQSKYVKRYKPLADSLGMEYGIPSALILGVAIIESSSGTSRNCRLLNNHFGLVGKNTLLHSKKIRTRYKQYPDARASYIDFCRLISKRKFYKKLKGNVNYIPWVDAISKSAYSEEPAIWKHRILSTIRKNKLADRKYTTANTL
jgi:flagellum-specific peptidoglycan hydrolase FlgJ